MEPLLRIIDIETSSPDTTFPDWSLDPRRSTIDLVGVTLAEGSYPVVVAKEFTKNEFKDGELAGHNFKFDFRTLHHKGYQLTVEQYAHDTLVMAVAAIEKVPESYLESYEKERRRLNKALPKGRGYRAAKKHSLKVLAPYFLGISPFWENTETHNDPEYLKKDVEYTKGLYEHFVPMLKRDGVWQFYQDNLMPWQRLTLQAELDGICIDVQAMAELKAKAELGVITSLAKLRSAWTKVEEEYAEKLKRERAEHFAMMTQAAVARERKKYTDKGKTPEQIAAKEIAVRSTYEAKAKKAEEKPLEPFNYASPSQLLWAFKEVLGYPAVNLEGDETTGASVLELLAAQGKEDIKALLEYKADYKLAHSYFPGYEELMVNGRINASFNLHGAKTGRLSSSYPNLQQIPKDLKKMFVAAPGNVLVSLDLNAIEPVLIAYYTEDENLCKIFIEGTDFHGYAATALFPAADLLPADVQANDVKKLYPDIRQAAKQADLSIFYGSGKNRLFTTLTLHGMKVTEQQCQKMVYRFKDTFQDAILFKQMLDAELGAGNYVENLFGRKYKIDNKEDIYMQGFNRLIQGSGSDLLLKGANDCIQELNKNNVWVRPRMFVHDCFVAECSEMSAETVLEAMTYHLTKFKLKTKHGNVPLRVEGGYAKCWKG